MFAHPRIKKAAPLPPKKRKRDHAVEEINFDDGAREEYLTGFHKRKLQRIKRAQEEAAIKARQERIDMRKQIREQRQRDVEEHVSQVEALLREHDHAGRIENEPESVTENVDKEEWEGLGDEPDDHEEEYIDEDKYTTVTVESVSVTRDGLQVQSDDESDKDKKDVNEETQAQKPKQSKENKKKKKFTYETKYDRQLGEKRRRAKKMKGR